jgi:predicted dehydrogenase
MSDTKNGGPSRREFLKTTGTIAAASTVLGAAAPRVHAAENNTINVALIGCGGRGTGAAANAMSVDQGPVKLVAMADVFEDKMKSSFTNLDKNYADKMDVPEDRRFLGFDAYKQAMDCLKPGDVAIFATPLAFRWVDFAYAVDKGLNVFMEKPLTSDGPTSRRMLELAQKSKDKNLKVGVGLMSRHSRHLEQLAARIQDGQLGDISGMRAYRMSGPIGSAFSERCPEDQSELQWQLRRFHSFLWASGGAFSDFCIHVIDHCCWMKDAWPVKAQGLGGRHYKNGPNGNPYVDQNFDSYAVEYTFDDGCKFYVEGRNMVGAANFYSSYLHGTKGSAIASKHGDCGPPSSIYKGQKPDKADLVWRSEVDPKERNPYQNEWNDLVDAIRNDKPFNEAERGVMASAVTSLGRKAAHTAQEITLEDMLNSPEEYAPGADQFTMDSPAPVQADADGKYPIPMPGLNKKTEY